MCFVVAVAISQRHHSSHYPFLAAERDDITSDIQRFYTEHIANKFPDADGNDNNQKLHTQSYAIYACVVGFVL